MIFFQISISAPEHYNEKYDCVICKKEFSNRNERNLHLERHFLHTVCKHCNKSLFIIGDLQFELHTTQSCSTNLSNCSQSTSNEDSSVAKVEIDVEVLESPSPTKHEDDSLVSDGGTERKSRRSRKKINYDEDELYKIAESSRTTEKTKKRKRENKQMNKSIKLEDEESIADYSASSSATQLLKIEITKYDESDAFLPMEITETEDFVDYGSSPQKADTDIGHVDNGNNDSENDDYFLEQTGTKRKRNPPKPLTIPCTVCEQMFRTDRSLKIHQKNVHGIKQSLECDICKRVFTSMGNLTQHKSIHSGSKRYICNYCGKGFHLPYNLKEHIHQHTGEKPYKCDVCDKRFGRQTLRAAHMRVSNALLDRFDSTEFHFSFFFRCTQEKSHLNATSKIVIELMRIQRT